MFTENLSIRKTSAVTFLWVILAFGTVVFAADHTKWGQQFSNNMISPETGLVDTFDPDTGMNIKWTAQLGSETWATPTVGSGRVFIGTNNSPPRDPRHKGDRGILICLDEKDGSFLWQLVVPKIDLSDPYLDWPRGGIVSPVTIEGNRAYTVTNRGEAVCLDINGQADGNDGPYTDEGAHMGLGMDETFEVTKKDADIIWLFDIPNQAGTYPHDAAHCSVLIDGEFLYLNTSNGVDSTHRRNRLPDGPSLIVLEKKTGRLLARDYEGMGHLVYHSTWSSPALGMVNGKKLIFFGGGDGVAYAFEALDEIPPEGEIKKLKRVWKFDCDPAGPKTNIHEYKRNRTESPSNIKGMPVFYNNRVYVAAGGDIWWGKEKAWLKCIDATKTGDITNSGQVWSYEMDHHCCSTPSIYNGLVFIADCKGRIHCLDADTGKVYWIHQTKGEIWASTLVADGKVYIGSRRKDFVILAADKEKKVLATIQMDSGCAPSPMAANGVLYIATMNRLYAIEKHQ